MCFVCASLVGSVSDRSLNSSHVQPGSSALGGHILSSVMRLNSRCCSCPRILFTLLGFHGGGAKDESACKEFPESRNCGRIREMWVPILSAALIPPSVKWELVSKGCEKDSYTVFEGVNNNISTHRRSPIAQCVFHVKGGWVLHSE